MNNWIFIQHLFAIAYINQNNYIQIVYYTYYDLWEYFVVIVSSVFIGSKYTIWSVSVGSGH